MDIDAVAHKVYLAAAEFEEQKSRATGRPQAKPGTFMIVVVGGTKNVRSIDILLQRRAHKLFCEQRRLRQIRPME